jgi:hypothetical protein
MSAVYDEMKLPYDSRFKVNPDGRMSNVPKSEEDFKIKK